MTWITLDTISEPLHSSQLMFHTREESIMAEATTKTTTTPRTRPSRAAATKTAAAKPATTATKTATKPAAAPTESATTDRTKVELVHAGDTKNFAKFCPPIENEDVLKGTLYAPLGTKRVVVMVVGAGDQSDD